VRGFSPGPENFRNEPLRSVCCRARNSDLSALLDGRGAGTPIAHEAAGPDEELMMDSFGIAAISQTSHHQHKDLHLRIRAEFAEMPGLKLTLPQASRLFNIDAAQCAHALERLVAAGCLSMASGSFVRAGGGRHSA
jgi:hypothetical protein